MERGEGRRDLPTLQGKVEKVDVEVDNLEMRGKNTQWAHQPRTLGWFPNQSENRGTADGLHATIPHFTDLVKPVSAIAKTATGPYRSIAS